MMYHIIATRTVLATLKSAREHNAAPRTPQILWSDADPYKAWRSCVESIGAIMGYTNGHELCLENGVPVYVTSDWTYWLVNDEKHKVKG